MLDAQHVISGDRLTICWLGGDGRCTARQGTIDWINSRTHPEDAAQNLFEQLEYIANHGERTKSDWFERMTDRPRVWAVRKARLRIYGFMVADHLYLCTHDELKKQNRADRRILDRTENLRDEWDAQWASP